MSKIAYINGRYLVENQAMVHITDRGYQFSDAAYEVILFIDKIAIDIDLHLDRLERTLSELHIKNPYSRRALMLNIKTLCEKNSVSTGMVYIQVSRGVAPRNHAIPEKEIMPTFVMTVKPLNKQKLMNDNHKALRLTLMPDNRWGRCDLKTVGLLPNILALHTATRKNFDDALFYDNQGITEGTSWNFWIINADGVLQTRPLEHTILWGITRHTFLKIAKEKKYSILEKTITMDDLKSAQGAFVTSATKIAMSVSQIDNQSFQTPHLFVRELRQAYINHFL